ncbi:unnamed protein product [Sphagnum tenellum]
MGRQGNKLSLLGYPCTAGASCDDDAGRSATTTSAAAAIGETEERIKFVPDYQQVYTDNIVPAGGDPSRSHAVAATYGRGNRLQYNPRLAAGNYTGAGDHTAAITYYYDGSGSDQTYMSSGAAAAAGRDSYSSGGSPAAAAGSSYYGEGTGTDQIKWTTFATGGGSEEYYVQTAGDVDHDQAVRYEGAAAAAGEYYDMNHINAGQDYSNAGAGTGVIMSGGNYGSIQDYSYHYNNMGAAGSDRCDINGVLQGGYNSSAAGAQALEYSEDTYYTTYTDVEYTAGRGVDQYTDQGLEHMQGVGVEYSAGVEYYPSGVDYTEEYSGARREYREDVEYSAAHVEYHEDVEYSAARAEYLEDVEYSAAPVAYSK